MSQQPYQDWDTIVFRKKQQNLKGESAARAAVRSGTTSTSVPRASGPNKASDDARHLIKIENEDGPQEIKHVSREVSLRIQKGRQAKGWTQKDLATRINEKQTVVNEYESCRAIPNNAILGKMERALGVKLRGQLN